MTLIRCVVILWDLTYAHVKQDSQEMETPALVSRLSLIENVCLICLFLNKPATTAIQHLYFFTLLALPIKFWLDGKKNTVKMTAWSMRTDKRCQAVRLCKQ